MIDEVRDVEGPATDDWCADDGLPVARLRVPSSGRWVAERYPTRSVTPDGDGWQIEVTVASERWLDDLLLRLGSEADVQDPPEWAGKGAAAARAVLARYLADEPDQAGS